MSSTTVVPLRERREFCAFFARQFEVEWPGWYGVGGKASAITDLEAFANPAGALPVGVVAIDFDGAPIGIAALRPTSISTHTHLGPWVTAGYVVPSRRRAGVGASLVSALVAESERLGLPTIYCATARAMTLLQRAGWQKIDAVVHDGERQYIYRRTVPCAV